MRNRNEFYFSPSDVQRLKRINDLIPELNQQASRLLRRCLTLCNRKQRQELAASLHAIGLQLKSLQKRREEMLACANEPQPSMVIVHLALLCEVCKNLPFEDLPLQKTNHDFVVLTEAEACPPQPQLDALLDLADFAEERLISGFKSRAGFERASFTRAVSALQSALLRQKAPLPRFRKSNSYPEPEIVVKTDRFRCSCCGTRVPWEWGHEDPRYLRALRRIEERKARQQGESDQ